MLKLGKGVIMSEIMISRMKRGVFGIVALAGVASGAFAAERAGWLVEQRDSQNGQVVWHKHESGRAQIIEYQVNESSNPSNQIAALLTSMAKGDNVLVDENCPSLKGRYATAYTNGRAAIQGGFHGAGGNGLCGFVAASRNGRENLVYWEYSFGNWAGENPQKLADQMAEAFVGP